MKKEELAGKNYIRLGGWLRKQYLYIDLHVNENFVADSLFYRRKIPVKFGDEMAKNGEKYRVIFCKVAKKYAKSFEEALDELITKMSLLGHNDYEDYCEKLIGQIVNSES